MTVSAALHDQLTQFADLSGKGRDFSLKTVHRKLGELCHEQSATKIVAAVSLMLGSGIAYYIRSSKPRCFVVALATMVAVAQTLHKASQARKQVDAILKCCNDTSVILSKVVSRVQATIREFVNASLTNTKTAVENEAKKSSETVVTEFFDAQAQFLKGTLTAYQVLERDALNKFFPRYNNGLMDRQLQALKPSYPAQQQLLDTCKDIRDVLHRIRWGCDRQQPQTTYFDLTPQDGGGIYQASSWPIALPKEEIKA